MTYVTAAQRPIAALGNGSAMVYRRHEFTLAQAASYRRLGVPAGVAAALRPIGQHITWLAQTFSVRALRRLSERNLRTRDVVLLRECADLHLSRLRGYVSRTDFRVGEIHWLMTHDVSSTQAIAWTSRLTPEFADTRIAAVLVTAEVLHGIPENQIAGWLRYANRHRVEFDGSQSPWPFLGGDTALFASAGLSPAEADQITRSSMIDRGGLQLLAGLRSHHGGG